MPGWKNAAGENVRDGYTYNQNGENDVLGDDTYRIGSALGASNFGQTRRDQMDFGQNVLDTAQNGQTSVAQQQLQQGLGQGARNAAAMAAGGGPGARSAAVAAQGQMAMDATQQAAMLRAAEMQAAQQQYMQMLQGQTGAALAGAQMEQDRMVAQAQHHAQMTGLANDRTSMDRSFGMQLGGAALGAAGSLMMLSDVRAKERIQPLMQQQPQPMASDPLQSGTQQFFQGLGTMVQGGPDAGGAQGAMPMQLSDERAKMNAYQMGRADAQAADIGRQLDAGNADAMRQMGLSDGVAAASARPDDAMLDSLRGYSYEYKPEAQAAVGAPPGRQFGVMAQDLEQTPMGQSLVVDTPAGKAIDGKAATGATLALTGRLAERDRETNAASMFRDQLLEAQIRRLSGGR